MTFRRTVLHAALAVCCISTTSLTMAQSNVLKVATDATFPPMQFVDNGKITGFDVELVEAMAQKMGKQVEWINTDFKGLIPGLVAKRYDMAVSAIYITDERKKVVDFSDSYYAGGLVAMVKTDSPIQTLKDLDGKKVSVQVGTKSVGYLTEHYPKVQRVEVEKNQEMFNLVAIGRADAAVTGKPAAFQYIRTRGGMRVLSEALTTEEYGMAIRKDQPELKQSVNKALADLKADGQYQALVEKWFPSK
ncbi:MAG: transporter substrate-binding domain-containing protein [Comamonas sp.]